MVEKVTITKGVKVPRGKESRMKERAGGSNVGKYKGVKQSDMAGTAGGAPRGSYPINTIERGRSALKLAHNAPNPAGIKRKVYSKYPSLKPSKSKNK